MNRQQFLKILNVLDQPDLWLVDTNWPAVKDKDLFKLAFQFALSRSLQQGPRVSDHAETHPHKLIKLAQSFANKAVTCPETPWEMQWQANQARQKLVAANLWDLTQPCWWEPLPPLDSNARLWFELMTSLEHLPQQSASTQSPFLHQQTLFLPPNMIKTLYQTLEQKYQQNQLPLQREGVGAKGTIAHQRNDEVLYLNGTDSELTKACPLLNVLVRWALTKLAPSLAKCANQPLLSAPQNAMLARYPAPSNGYHAHIDNPGGAYENGRSLTAILYLNPESAKPSGGGLELFLNQTDHPTATTSVSAWGGNLAAFDARHWVHQVTPLELGPPRWALSMWLNDAQPGVSHSQGKQVDTTELFLGINKPSLPANTLAFHHLNESFVTGSIQAYPKIDANPKAGIVCTTYRGQFWLPHWCQHHLALGFSHLFLVFDHLEDSQEAQLADDLQKTFPAHQLTILNGQELRQQNWPHATRFPQREKLERMAQSSGTSWSVSARQALNASEILQLLKQSHTSFPAIDWLLHIDSDEFFHLKDSSRGGETLRDHFAVASHQGWSKIRYSNYELLTPWQPGQPTRFKINPRIAATRLGKNGWRALCEQLEMYQHQSRPYFLGYHNGKSAVAVAEGEAAAGVHDWYLAGHSSNKATVLAGPVVLHCHNPNPKSLLQKYQAKQKQPAPEETPLFQLSPMEEAIAEKLQSFSPETPPEQQLLEIEALFQAKTQFSTSEYDLLQVAGLLEEVALFAKNPANLPDVDWV